MLKRLIVFCLSFFLSNELFAATQTIKDSISYKLEIKKFRINKSTKYGFQDKVSMAISENNIFLSRACNFYVLTKTGGIIQNYDFCTMGKNFNYVPNIAIGGNSVFISPGTKDLYSINKKLFKLEWSRQLSTYLRSKILADGDKLFFSSTDNKLYALSQMNGRIIWSHYTSKNTLDNLPPSQPLISDNIVVFNYSPGYITGVGRSGDILWNQNINFFNLFIGMPSFIIEKSLFTLDKGQLIEVSLNDGMKKWNLKNQQQIKALTYSNNKIIFVTQDKMLTAIDSKTKKELWSVSFRNKVRDIIALKNFIIILNNYGYVSLFDSNNGRLLDIKQLFLSKNKSPFIKHNNKIYTYAIGNNSVYEIMVVAKEE